MFLTIAPMIRMKLKCKNHMVLWTIMKLRLLLHLSVSCSNKLLTVKFCSKSWASLSMSLGLPVRDWACKPKLLHESLSSSSYMPTPYVTDQHEQDNNTLDTVFCWSLLETHLVRVFLTDLSSSNYLSFSSCPASLQQPQVWADFGRFSISFAEKRGSCSGHH
jgi:hypothetical protein